MMVVWFNCVSLQIFKIVDMDEILKFAEARERQAWQVLADSRVREIWQEAGAEVRLVGSLRMSLLCRHRDIDLHVYSEGITAAGSFAVMSRLAEDPRVAEIRCINGLHTDERCIAWHVQYCATDGERWQIDVIHIERGSRYDGFFEQVADRIVSRITDGQRQTILRLKYETPEDEVLHGVEYYQAVMEAGVTTLAELRRWVTRRRAASGEGYWMPE